MYRIIYEIAGDRHTFWTREYDVNRHGMIEAVNVTTGQQKLLSTSMPLNITEVDSYPHKVEEALDEQEVPA